MGAIQGESMFFYFDPLYMVVMLVGVALSVWASAKVKGAFKRYKEVPASFGITGMQVAQRILQRAGVNCAIEPVQGRSFFGNDGGDLSDHYDPRSKTVRLSPSVYSGNSIAAYGIAAHEVGHAIQHAQGYKLLQIRNAIVPVANIGSQMSYWLIILGFMLHTLALAKLGIILFSAAVFFQIITVPVELDASRRAKKYLRELGLTTSVEESKGVAAVLDAAALTYVAAAATAILNLLYLIMRYNRR